MRDSTARVWICIALVLVTFALYWPVRHHAFINYDDPLYVTHNPNVKAGLTWHGVVWAFRATEAHNWHPLTWLSHMLDCQLFGPNPGAHHLVNVAFHALNAVLLYLVLGRMTGAWWRSAAVAALFALHPLQVGSVAWIAERKNLLSTSFWLLTLWAYARYAEATTRASKRNAYSLALVCFALGLMCKPMLVTVPFVLLLLDGWPLRRLQLATLGSRLVEKLPFFALGAASSAATIWAATSEAQERSFSSLHRLPLGLRIENALISYLRYLGKMIWPVGLSVFYPYPTAWPLWLALLSALALALITLSALRWAARCPPLLVGWLWFMGTLVPVIGLVQVGVQSMADRFMYVPMIGLLIAIVWGVSELSLRWNVPKPVVSVVAAMVLVACATLTRLEVRRWKDTETLLKTAFERTPQADERAAAAYGVVEPCAVARLLRASTYAGLISSARW